MSNELSSPSPDSLSPGPEPGAATRRRDLPDTVISLAIIGSITAGWLTGSIPNLSIAGVTVPGGILGLVGVVVASLPTSVVGEVALTAVRGVFRRGS